MPRPTARSSSNIAVFVAFCGGLVIVGTAAIFGLWITFSPGPGAHAQASRQDAWKQFLDAAGRGEVETRERAENQLLRDPAALRARLREYLASNGHQPQARATWRLATRLPEKERDAFFDAALPVALGGGAPDRKARVVALLASLEKPVLNPVRRALASAGDDDDDYAATLLEVIVQARARISSRATRDLNRSYLDELRSLPAGPKRQRLRKALEARGLISAEPSAPTAPDADARRDLIARAARRARQTGSARAVRELLDLGTKASHSALLAVLITGDSTPEGLRARKLILATLAATDTPAAAEVLAKYMRAPASEALRAHAYAALRSSGGGAHERMLKTLLKTGGLSDSDADKAREALEAIRARLGR